MTIPTTCSLADERGFPERYLASTLSETEAVDFESHFLACDRCQEVLRIGAALRQTLTRETEQTSTGRSWLIVGIPVGIAAVIGGILVLGGSPDAEITRLGALIEAPVYLGIPVRAELQVRGDSVFEAAMRAYMDERFVEAAAGLRQALDAGVDAPPAEFFLGASLLMTGRAGEAEAAFGRVISSGTTPYLAEARFYRAKALLQLGRAGQALEQLGLIPPEHAVIGNYGRALADSIVEAQRR